LFFFFVSLGRLTTTIWLLSKDGSRSGYNIGIEVNSAGFLFMKFLLGLVFVLGLGFALGLGYVGNGFCGCYWEGLCG